VTTKSIYSLCIVFI
jgi:ATP synthase F1 delta subunit